MLSPKLHHRSFKKRKTVDEIYGSAGSRHGIEVCRFHNRARKNRLSSRRSLWNPSLAKVALTKKLVGQERSRSRVTDCNRAGNRTSTFPLVKLSTVVRLQSDRSCAVNGVVPNLTSSDVPAASTPNVHCRLVIRRSKAFETLIVITLVSMNANSVHLTRLKECDKSK